MIECKLKDYIENANFEDSGFSYTLSLISGKYKMIILYCLMEYKAVRFNELQRYLKKISDKTLSQNLKELEKDGLIHREVYPQSYVPGAKKIEDQSLKRVNHNFSGIGGPGGFFLKTFSIYSRYPCSKILNAQLLSVNFCFRFVVTISYILSSIV